MTNGDFHDSNDYAELVGGWRETGAVDVGTALGEREEFFDAYTWYLIADDVGEEDAGDMAKAIETAELVCDEDMYLAHLQVAAWLARGIRVEVDPPKALAHLKGALAFVDEDTFDLPVLPSEANVDAAVVNALIDSVFAQSGWPTTLDLMQPLGPAMPGRPYWIHSRHHV